MGVSGIYKALVLTGFFFRMNAVLVLFLIPAVARPQRALSFTVYGFLSDGDTKLIFYESLVSNSIQPSSLQALTNGWTAGWLGT